jgi:hypothetical protein
MPSNMDASHGSLTLKPAFSKLVAQFTKYFELAYLLYSAYKCLGAKAFLCLAR